LVVAENKARNEKERTMAYTFELEVCHKPNCDIHFPGRSCDCGADEWQQWMRIRDPSCDIIFGEGNSYPKKREAIKAAQIAMSNLDDWVCNDGENFGSQGVKLRARYHKQEAKPLPLPQKLSLVTFVWHDDDVDFFDDDHNNPFITDWCLGWDGCSQLSPTHYTATVLIDGDSLTEVEEWLAANHFKLTKVTEVTEKGSISDNLGFSTEFKRVRNGWKVTRE
jgi:hypothetical protein